ncbi:MAG: hypothetical protein KTR32_28740 [Granulosicoccus sp.]|nr:hypothetical protein [Granulosicoccus sp.]
MTINYSLLIVAITTSLVLIGCAGNNDSEVTSAPTGEMTSIETSTDAPNKSKQRIKTISYDFEQDGDTDLVWTYDYDNLGRIITRTEDNKVDPDRSKVVNYEYDGNQLVRKYIEDGVQDVHTYQDGLLVASSRHWDGEHTYSYDASGRLIGATGDDFKFDDDCDSAPLPVSSQDELPVESFVMSYSGDKLDTVVSSDGLKMLTFNYNEKQQLIEIVESVSCGGEEVFEVAKQTFSYDDAGLLKEMNRFSEDLASQKISDLETVAVSRDASGNMTELVETVPNGQNTTIKRTYGTDGLPSSDNVTYTGPSILLLPTPDQILSYTYEDESCQIAYSSNPTTLLLLDSFPQNSTDADALKCGYKLDEREL